MVSIAHPLALVRIQPVDGRLFPGIAERDLYALGALSECDRKSRLRRRDSGSCWRAFSTRVVAGGVAAPGRFVPQVGEPLPAPAAGWTAEEGRPFRPTRAPLGSLLVVEPAGSKRVVDPILVPVGVRVVHGRVWTMTSARQARGIFPRTSFRVQTCSRTRSRPFIASEMIHGPHAGKGRQRWRSGGAPALHAPV